MSEQEALTNSLNFIRYQAWKFIGEQQMVPKNYYFDDVFQEACIAWLTWYRKCQNGESNNSFAASFIRYHLLKRFYSRNGFTVDWRTAAELKEKNESLPYTVAETETAPTDPALDDMTAVYVRDFLRKLTDLDRTIAVMMMNDEKPGEIMEAVNIPRSTLQYRRKVIRKCYDDYNDKKVG